MWHAFKDHLQNNFPNLVDSRVLIAVSGGVDSVVLAHLCKRADLEFALAHCNFNLRGQESAEDEAFVNAFAESLGAEVFIQGFDTLGFARNEKLSVQMAARELRYRWFGELQRDLGFDYILTAHHANDDLETLLINLVRGTGLDGLTGIPEVNGVLVRPLLSFSRDEILKYAQQEQLQWREDSSNSSRKYLRNKIRLEVLPLFLEMNPGLMEGYKKTRLNLKQSASLVQDYLSGIFPELVKEETFGYRIDISRLLSMPHPRAILYELLHDFGFTAWDDIYELLKTEPGKLVNSATHRLVKDRDTLLLTTHPEEDLKEYEIASPDTQHLEGVGKFVFERVPEVGPTGKHILYLDADKITFPLKIRKKKKGDSFYPFGMKGRKKISKFFKDEKLSLPEKEETWLLCSDHEIVWIIGYRMDARFCVDAQTKSVIKITYSV